jgi:RimJ/RimL family protein N-acetyltransferase
VPSGNKRALHFDKRMGFKEVARIKDAHPDGELIILSMRRDECRFLEKEKDGKQSYSSAA